MNKIQQLEQRIEGLKRQFEAMKRQLGPGPHVDALEEGTRVAVAELEDRLSYLRAGKPDPYE